MVPIPLVHVHYTLDTQTSKFVEWKGSLYCSEAVCTLAILCTPYQIHSYFTLFRIVSRQLRVFRWGWMAYCRLTFNLKQ